MANYLISLYEGTFLKKNGQERYMQFFKLEDLPSAFLNEIVHGGAPKRELPAGQELVWDIDADNWRIFNHSTIVVEVKYLGNVEFDF